MTSFGPIVSKATLASLAAVLLSAAPLGAASLMETRDEDGTVQRIYVEGRKMRVQERDGEEYMLFDLEAKKLYAVRPAAKEAVDMSGMLSESAAASATGVRLEHKGQGPSIAGYATEHYLARAGEKTCTEEFLSRQAAEDLGAAPLLEALASLGAEEDGDSDPCEQAERELAKLYGEHGIPLRVVETDGTVSMEVTRIEKNVPAPAGGFHLPEGYRVVTLDAEVRKAMEEAQKSLEGLVPPEGGAGAGAEEFRRALEELQKKTGQ